MVGNFANSFVVQKALDLDLDPLDAFVGSRIQVQRTLRGLSQKAAADLLGITHQQMQKYESGSERVSASRLFEISHVLGMPISYFFEDMPEDTSKNPTATQCRHMPISVDKWKLSDDSGELFGERETMELVYAYYRISEDIRGLTLDLIKSLATPEVMH